MDYLLPIACAALGALVAVLAFLVREAAAQDAEDSTPASLPPGAWRCRGLLISDAIDSSAPHPICQRCRRLSDSPRAVAPCARQRDDGTAWCLDRIAE